MRITCLVCAGPALHLDTRLVEREVQADATRTRLTRIVRCLGGCDGDGQREQEVKVVVIDMGPTPRRTVSRDQTGRHR